jgi:hypothetical protein
VVFWTLCFDFSSISFIPFDVSPAERGVDGCNGGQPVVALAYRPRAGAGLFLHLWHGFLLRVCAYWTLGKGFPIALFIGFVILAAQGGSFSATCALTASVILVVGIMGKRDSLNWPWIQGWGLSPILSILFTTP